MKEVEFKNIDLEEIEDILIKVDDSFNIKFGGNELAHIKTFGEMCDHIKHKIELDNEDDCTTQQAFNKLRETFSITLKLEKDTITPKTPLVELLPRKNRKYLTKRIEKDLGFKLNILRPPHFLIGFLFLILLSSFILSFYNLQYGMIGLLVSLSGSQVARKIGKELKLKTVGQLADKITVENYSKSRRNPKTFNKNEIEKILTDWFSKELNIDKSKLTRESILI